MTVDPLTVTHQPRVFYVTALGDSAKSFLIPHFQELKKAGFELFLACSNDLHAHSVENMAGITHLAIPLKAEISLFSDVHALFVLSRNILRLQPQVVHGHMSKAGLASMIASWVCRVPTRIYHNHGMACFSSTGMARQLLMMVEKISCSLATEIVFCSHSTRKLAIELGICSAKKSFVIGEGTISGVDIQHFSPENAEAESGDIIKLLDDATKEKHYIGYVGRVVRHKGIDTLIAAWSQLPTEFRDKWTLLIAGDHSQDELYARLDALVRSDSSVKYLGRIENIVGFYGLIDIVVLPSWHEGFPYSILEAQSCGVPAVVTNVTGNKDAVVDGITGRWTEAHSAEALANAFLELASKNTAVTQMKSNARQRIVKDFSEKTVMRNLINFYKLLIEK